MKKQRWRLEAALAAALVAAIPSAAMAGMVEDVKAVNDGWAHIAYEVKGSSTQTKALDKLAQQAATLTGHYPNKAEPLLWQGIVTSEQANRANIFHKLSLARKARDLLAKAYAIDPKAANGGAAMSLAVLYYKVPGSPLGFGDDRQGEAAAERGAGAQSQRTRRELLLWRLPARPGRQGRCAQLSAESAQGTSRPRSPGLGRGPSPRGASATGPDQVSRRIDGYREAAGWAACPAAWRRGWLDWPRDGSRQPQTDEAGAGFARTARR